MADVSISLRLESPARYAGTLQALGVTAFTMRTLPSKLVGEPVDASGSRPPVRSFASIAADPASGSVLVLDVAQQQLFRQDSPLLWTPVATPPGASKLVLVASVSASEWLAVDDRGLLWRQAADVWSEVGCADAPPVAMVADRTQTVWVLLPSGDLRAAGWHPDSRTFGTWTTIQVDGVSSPGPGALAVGPNGQLVVAQRTRRRVSILSGNTWTRLEGPDLPVDAPDLVAVGPDGTIYCRNAPHDPVQKVVNGVAVPDVGGQFYQRDVYGTWSAMPGVADPALSMAVDASGVLYLGRAMLLSRRPWVTTQRGLAIGFPDGSFFWVRRTYAAAFQDRVALPFVALAADGSKLGKVVLQLGVGMEPGVEGAPTAGPAQAVTATGAAVAIPLQACGSGALSFSAGATAQGAGDVNPAHGQLSAIDAARGWVTYTPDAGFQGDDAFTFRASIDGKASAPARVGVQVVALPPVVVQVPAGGASVVPAPGVLGALSFRQVDVSKRTWCERRWRGLRAPTSVVHQVPGESVWVTTPGDYRSRVGRRSARGDVFAYGGTAGQAPLQAPASVVALNGVTKGKAVGGGIYVADPGAVFYRDDATGVWTVFLPLTVGGLATHDFCVYLTDPERGLIHRYVCARRALEPVQVAAGSAGPKRPQAIAVDTSGVVWVTDQASDAVYRLDKGTWTPFDAAGSGIGALARPRGVAVDRDGIVWIADTGNNRVVTVDPRGTPSWQVIDTGHGPLSAPEGISVDAHDGVWVADTGNDRLLHLACFQEGACARVELRADGSVRVESFGLTGSDTFSISAPSTDEASSIAALPVALTVTVPSN